MRILTVLLLPATLLWALPSAAQTPAPGQQAAAPPATTSLTPPIGEVALGVRITGVSGDSARFQRLRDLRDGPTLDRLRYERDTDTWRTRVVLDHVGYRDQRYAMTFEQYGKLRASVSWDQIPLFYSTDTRTPFMSDSPGVFRLDDALQGAIQGGAPANAVLAPVARAFDLRSRRDVADVRVIYALRPTLDLKVSFTSTGRTGAQPWGTSFGFANAVELAIPVEHRTNDVQASAEWSTPRAMARVALDSSWFANEVETLVWDNPLRLTDSATAPAQGRIALWPDSTAHTVSAAGSLALPWRSRGFAAVSIGSWLQDQELLPHTINTALPPVPLARDSAEAEARIVTMNYRLTARPSPLLWLNGQFRLYDYDNRTPHFALNQYVRTDSAVATSLTGGSEPFGYTRHFVDLDASFTPFQFAAFRVGYGREHDDRTFRFLEQTTENTLRASIDSTGFAWGSVRLQYDLAVRTGEGLDEQVLSDIGEQVSLRQFDISDRTRHRVSALLQVVPWQVVGFTASAGVGQEHRPNTAFGLQDNDLKSFTFGVDMTPRDAIGFGLSYGFENYATLQRSRQANPGVQFDDPTRDWSTDMNEDVHTFTATLDVAPVNSRTTARFGYDLVRSNTRYLYILPPNSTLAVPQQLPPVENDMRRATADVRYALSRQVALGLGYTYDRYEVEDFARSPGTLNSPVFTGFVNLMYQSRPYDAHTAAARLIYRW